MAEKQGKVWLVGAGPGAVGLLTLKGKELLEEADVIVYDQLVGKEVLSVIDTKKEMIFVGKESGHHAVPQKEIQQILVQAAREGKRVVRLKGGDPFLFGRGGEEARQLREEGIPFEVVPGVTSSLAVPAYNGIPVTHRDYASSLQIITGHKKQGEKDPLAYQEIVKAGGTLVFLMGVTALPKLMEGLIRGGLPKETGAAVLQEGTTARQKKVLATIGTLAEEAAREGIRPPALIVVGEVCRLSEELDWYEKLPLSHTRILLTRPRETIRETARKLRQRGAEVLEVPAICVSPARESEELKEVGRSLERWTWIVLTSQIGVRMFWEQMKVWKKDIRSLAGARFAVIGPGTRRELEERGIYADFMPEVYAIEQLANGLKDRIRREDRILIPRAGRGNPVLPQTLKEVCKDVRDVALYDTECQRLPRISLWKELKEEDTYVMFTSSFGVACFVEQLERERAETGRREQETDGRGYDHIRALCIGEETAKKAREYRMQCYVAEEATVDGLLELTERIRQKNGKTTEKIKKQ